MQEPAANQLADHALPFFLLARRAGAEHREPVVSGGRGLFVAQAAQHVGDVSGAVAFAGLAHGFQYLARGIGSVGHRARRQTEIAIAARLHRLAEIAQQHLAAAARRLAIADQRVQALMLAALALLARFLLVDEDAAHADVAEAEQHVGFGLGAVASGAADLLVIGFQAARQVGMKHETDIGFVDAHAEGDGRDHDDGRLGHEAALVEIAQLLVQPGVIGQRRDAILAKERRGLLGLLAREAIDDAALAAVLRDEGEQLFLAVALGLDGEADVGTVEAEHNLVGLAVEQFGDDVGARDLVCRGGQGGDRHAGKKVL